MLIPRAKNKTKPQKTQWKQTKNIKSVWGDHDVTSHCWMSLWDSERTDVFPEVVQDPHLSLEIILNPWLGARIIFSFWGLRYIKMAVVPGMGSEHPQYRSMHYLKYDLSVGTCICHLAVERKWHIKWGILKRSTFWNWFNFSESKWIVKIVLFDILTSGKAGRRVICWAELRFSLGHHASHH